MYTVIKRDGKITELKDVTFETYTDEDGYKQMVIDFYVYPAEKTFFNVIRESVHWTISLARTIFLSRTVRSRSLRLIPMHWY